MVERSVFRHNYVKLEAHELCEETEQEPELCIVQQTSVVICGILKNASTQATLTDE
jgi:hypothetical protein